MAVDESASERPTIRDGAPPLPNSAAMPAMTAAVTTTWSMPNPNTNRGMVSRRWKESSRPMRNIKNTTPSSAMPATRWASAMVTQ
jgi:hypothetical protein